MAGTGSTIERTSSKTLEGRRYRLYLSADQERRCERIAGACRAVWNAALEQRRLAYRMTGRSPGYKAQCADLTEAREAFEWLAEAPAQALQQTLRDLRTAYERFFKGQARYPRYKRKGRGESFRVPQRVKVRRVNRRWAEVRLAKLGWCRFRRSRELGGEIRYATVSRDGLGWHVSFCVATARQPAPANRGPAVGVDRGVAVAAALSTGELVKIDGLVSAGEAKRKLRLERRAARQEDARRHRPPSERQRSRRHQRTEDQIAGLKAREARRRKDRLHKLTTRLAKSHALVAIEALEVGNMTASAKGTVERPGRKVRQKAGLNRAILARGWGELERQLGYKCRWYGSELVKVPAQNTSRTCAACGAVDAASRRSQAEFCCVACGHAENADVNAARVILARALGSEGSAGGHPVPARRGRAVRRPGKREPTRTAA